jgi:hypothetical protein
MSRLKFLVSARFRLVSVRVVRSRTPRVFPVRFRTRPFRSRSRLRSAGAETGEGFSVRFYRYMRCCCSYARGPK